MAIIYEILCQCVCGFLTFGSTVNQEVLVSYPPNDVSVAVARAFITQRIDILSYPTLLWWCALVMYGMLLVIFGTFIFGQTTTSAILVDLSV